MTQVSSQSGLDERIDSLVHILENGYDDFTRISSVDEPHNVCRIDPHIAILLLHTSHLRHYIEHSLYLPIFF